MRYRYDNQSFAVNTVEHAVRKPRLKGLWAVSVFGNWRIVFRFEKGHAYDVDLVDYH